MVPFDMHVRLDISLLSLLRVFHGLSTLGSIIHFDTSRDYLAQTIDPVRVAPPTRLVANPVVG